MDLISPCCSYAVDFTVFDEYLLDMLSVLDLYTHSFGSLSHLETHLMAEFVRDV